jgi:MFS family permease
LGRQRTYIMYLGVGAVLYVLVALLGDNATAIFVTLTFFIVSFYGGGFATIPAYLKDLFGKLEVGAIHGRVLTAWSAAGVAGPLIVNTIVDSRRESGLEGAELYMPSLLVMACLLSVGFVANLFVRPVDEKFHEPIIDLSSLDEELLLVTAGHKES